MNKTINNLKTENNIKKFYKYEIERFKNGKIVIAHNEIITHNFLRESMNSKIFTGKLLFGKINSKLSKK